MKFFLIARQELDKLFATRRGWVSLIGFGLVWVFAVLGLIRLIANKIRETQTEAVISSSLDQFGFKELGQWPTPELALYWFAALYLLPLFALIVCADQTASDKTRKTLRFLSLRANREEIFFGRFVGQFLIQLLIVLATLISVLGLIAWSHADQLNLALQRVPMLIANLTLVLLPYIALMALASIIARSARQATIFAIIGWIVASILIAVVQNYFGPLSWLDWILPGSQISSLLSLSNWDTMRLAHIPIVHTAVLLGLGWWAMRRVAL